MSASLPVHLPHGPGFHFISELVELVPGGHARARYLLRGDEWFLPAHFPGRPMMPGVLMIEALAQVGGVLVQADPAWRGGTDLLLTAVQQAKILGSAVPGETLEIEAKPAGMLDGLAMVQGEVRVRGQVVLQARVTLCG